MKTTPTRKARKAKREAFHVATLGRAKVPIYRRTAPNGSPCFMVVNYSTGKRRFDSYADEALALEAANKLARQMSEREVIAAAMTNEQASEYGASVQKLRPWGVSLLSGADTLADCLKLVGGLAEIRAACQWRATHHRTITPKSVADVVVELLKVKAARRASGRYVEDLRSRLNRFAADCQKNIGDVTTADVQAWLDGQKLAPQTIVNFRRVLHVLFTFAKARGYCLSNVVADVEKVKVRNDGSVAIYSPSEIVRLLAAAAEDFLPCIVLQAFTGLRSAEVERLTWADVRLVERNVVVGADAAKTASRRVCPLSDNAVAWLQSYAERKGSVWEGTHKEFYEAQQATATAAGLSWKANALRHSAASYMFALCHDAGRVAGFLGNSAAVIHKHYRELVKPADAVKWFTLTPPKAAKILAPPNFANALATN